jgi:hypothetical protein
MSAAPGGSVRRMVTRVQGGVDVVFQAPRWSERWVLEDGVTMPETESYLRTTRLLMDVFVACDRPRRTTARAPRSTPRAARASCGSSTPRVTAAGRRASRGFCRCGGDRRRGSSGRCSRGTRPRIRSGSAPGWWSPTGARGCASPTTKWASNAGSPAVHRARLARVGVRAGVGDEVTVVDTGGGTDAVAAIDAPAPALDRPGTPRDAPTLAGGSAGSANDLADGLPSPLIGVNRWMPMRAGQAPPLRSENSPRRGGACPARPSIDG